MPAQFALSCRTEPSAELCCDTLLDQRHCAMDFYGVLHAGPRNGGAAVALDLDQTVIGKANQRLAYDLCKPSFARLAPWHEAMIKIARVRTSVSACERLGNDGVPFGLHLAAPPSSL
jgi:hypothetical protein